MMRCCKALIFRDLHRSALGCAKKNVMFSAFPLNTHRTNTHAKEPLVLNYASSFTEDEGY